MSNSLFITKTTKIDGRLENVFQRPTQKFSDARKKEFLLGRSALNQSLFRMDQSFDLYPTFSRNSLPLLPMNVVGSISHKMSQAYAASAYKADYRSLGVDIEFSKIATLMGKKILSSTEFELIDDEEDGKSAKLALIFSSKESFFKCAYPLVKTFFSFDALVVKKINAESIDFELNLKKCPFLTELSRVEIKWHQDESFVYTRALLRQPS